MRIKTTMSALSIAVSLALPGSLMAQTQDSASTDALRQELDALKIKFSELEEKQYTQPQQKSEKSNGFSIGDTDIAIGGMVKGDLTISNNGFSNGVADEALSANKIKANTSDELGERVNLTARESRLFIKTETPDVGGKNLKSRIEVDFYGDDNSEFVTNGYGLRLRHAYISWGHWLTGQTWSTFMDLSQFGEMLNFGKHASQILIRQPQIRYTLPTSFGDVRFAVENPEDGGDDQGVPDLVSQINWNGSWGHASAGVLLRKLQIDTTTDRDSKWVDAYSLTSRIPTFGKDDIRMQANYGNLGRYMGLRTYPDALQGGVTGSQEIDGVDAWGASVAYRHFWAPNWRSSLILSRSERITDGAGDDNKQFENAAVNLIWQVNPSLSYGGELQYYRVEEFDGDAFDLSRLQLTAKLTF